ncbi:MAG: hypothetical protein DMF95_09475 [Acidobacteria bacterium]|nr:MAG: hypothetical protein DMF96_21575 [Acidobacteriota bacterium]PYR15490.1 MAG: hypothetical protein DMF94_31820 [Acidobacteriota bacterium]PYR50906.1 MAG: hypothetical protein DMF95_09475 [Acidobacteriota bacterium]
MDLKFFKERYDFELQRKEQLTSAPTLPVGVLSGLGGLMAAMVRSFPHKTRWLTVPFGAAFALDVVGFFFCSGLLHRARLALFAVLICTTAAGVLYVLDQEMR